MLLEMIVTKKMPSAWSLSSNIIVLSFMGILKGTQLFERTERDTNYAINGFHRPRVWLNSVQERFQEKPGQKAWHKGFGCFIRNFSGCISRGCCGCLPRRKSRAIPRQTLLDFIQASKLHMAAVPLDVSAQDYHYRVFSDSRVPQWTLVTTEAEEAKAALPSARPKPARTPSRRRSTVSTLKPTVRMTSHYGCCSRPNSLWNRILRSIGLGS